MNEHTNIDAWNFDDPLIENEIDATMEPFATQRRYLLLRATERRNVMNAYIDLMSETTGGTYGFSEDDLKEIGEFTRENVQRWMDRDCYARRELFVQKIPIGPVIDFHAVCGTVEIPWAEEGHAARWERDWEEVRRQKKIALRESAALREAIQKEKSEPIWRKFSR